VKISPRGWAVIGELLGIGLSIAANATEASHRKHGMGPVAVAGFIPILLFVALRILTTAKIQGGRRWFLWPAFATLAAVFAITSYLDQKALLLDWSFDHLSAHILPLGIDGLMVISAVVLLPEATAALPVAAVLVTNDPPVPMFHVEPEPDYVRPVVMASEAARPRRATAPVTTAPSATKEDFLLRAGTENPMTIDEIHERDGGTRRSAESKAYRWKKAMG